MIPTFGRLLIVVTAILGAAGVIVSPTHSQIDNRIVYVAEMRGVINPPMANYFERALEEAESQKADLVVVMLDTPGGLDTSMRQIDQAILASSIPVAVYVAPSGSRAASAGLFILMSSHIAVMAPGTNTGAAHPVGLGGEADETLTQKAVNDAAATIRAITRERGRNEQWAEQAVRESVSITAQEALDMNVIDLIAQDLEDLLNQIDGQMVETRTGTVTLETMNATVQEVPMNFAENLLHTISDPNIAYILLSVGSIGILAELYNPGIFIAGITGTISLILAFYSLGNLPTNWAGVALIALAVLLFVAELATEGTGVLGVGAVIALVLGGLILFRPIRADSPALPDISVSPWVIASTAALVGSAVLLVMGQLVRSRHAPILSGPEQMVGQIAVVRQELSPRGRVWFEGQTWNAVLRSDRSVPAGHSVRIIGLEGLTLIVESVDEG